MNRAGCCLLFLLVPVVARSGPYEEGAAALKAGKVAAAIQALERAVKAQPSSPDAWWELGWARWARRDLEPARDAWLKVRELQPDRPELAHWLAAAEYKLALARQPLDSSEVPAQPAGEQRIRIAAAGDSMLGSDIRKGADGLAPGDGETLFADVKPFLAAADVALLNLEGALADGLPQKKCGPRSRSCYPFRTPTRYTAALVEAGIDVASLANNHIMDLGVAGMDATIAALDKAGIAHAGRYGDVTRLEVKGVKIAVVAAHSGSCCVNVNDIEELTRAIRSAAEGADIVVLSVHAGAEGDSARHVPGKLERAYGEDRGDVKKAFRAAVDAGADLVIGHGPHVLRAMEVYRSRLIVYSLGNFCGFRQFGLGGGYWGTTVILDAELAANGVLLAARLHAVALDGEGAPHPDPSGAGLDQVRELSKIDFPATGVEVREDGSLSWK